MRNATIVVTFLYALGFPFSWHKLFMGLEFIWLGMTLHLGGIFLDPTPDRIETVLAFLEAIVEGRCFLTKVLHSSVSRLNWVIGARPHLRPLLQPLWAWCNAVRRAGKPGKLHQAIAIALSAGLRHPRRPVAFLKFAPHAAATGAGADPSRAAVGGWWCSGCPSTKSDCLWFAESLTPSNAPWAWDLGDPRRRIAAMELYADLCLLRMLGAVGPNKHHAWRVRSLMDNLGGVFATSRNYSRAPPWSYILMETCLLQNMTNIFTTPCRVMREDNTWADELTHLEVTEWCPSKRYTVNHDESLAMHKLLASIST